MDIQNLMKYVTNRPTPEPSLKELAEVKTQLSELQSKYIDISKMQNGETLKGEVINLEQNILEVLTTKGQLFKGKLSDNLPVNIGETREFIVNNKNGNSTLSMVDIPSETVQRDKILSTLKDLGQICDDKNLQIAKELLSNKLPINKDTIQQVKTGMYYVENSTDSENPLNKAIFLIKNNMPTTKENVETLNNINNKENTLSKNLDTIFQKLETLPDKSLAKDISTIFDKFKPLAQEGNSVLLETQQKQEAPPKDVNTTAELPKMEEPIKEQALPPKTSTESILSYDKDGKLIKKDLPITEDLEEVITEKLKSDQKENNLHEKIKSPKEFFKEIEDDLSDLKESLTKALKVLEKADDESTKGLKNELKALNSKLDFYNDLKNNTFLQFPLNINKDQSEVNLKVFNDKKNKKTDEDAISALISLYTENLGLFGTYIQKNKKNLNIQFRLEDKETENLVMQNINTLKAILKPLNYTIDSVTFKNIADSNRVDIEEKDILEINDYNQRIVFDVKG